MNTQILINFDLKLKKLFKIFFIFNSKAGG